MKESFESTFKPKSSRTFTNPKLTSFPHLSTPALYDQVIITSPNLTNFKNYANFINSQKTATNNSETSLVYLKLDNTGIATYEGAKKTPSLKYIFLANTPLSRYHYYRVMTAIVFGPDTLEEIDHAPIKKSERAFSLSNHEFLYQYLIDGWLLTMINPIRIFNPVTRKRRVLYPPADKRKTAFGNTNSSTLSQKAGESMKNLQKTEETIKNLQKIETHRKSLQKSAQKDEEQKKESQVNDEINFMRFLEKTFFETDLNSLFCSKDQKDASNSAYESVISEIQKALSNNHSKSQPLFDSNTSLFINFVLRAAALRPLYVDYIVKIVKSVLNEEVHSILKQSIFQVNFYSNLAFANFIESLLENEVFTNDDVKPLFFSVYERFEDWNSPFSLIGNDEEETAALCGKKPLTAPFIEFFCPFSSLIQKVDPELYSSLIEHAGAQEKARIETYMKNAAKKREIWSALFSDDYGAFFDENGGDPHFSKEELKQCVVDLTPWDVHEEQVESAFAFSGSPNCLFHSSLFSSSEIQSSDLDDVLKVSIIAGGSVEIFSKFKSVFKEENAIELGESAVRFHRFEIFREIVNSFGEGFELGPLLGVAVDSMEVNIIDFIMSQKEAQVGDDEKAALLNRAIAASVVNIDSDLNGTAKSLFINPLNSIIFGGLSVQTPFVVYLYKIGFRSEDCLMASIQSQSIRLVRFFLQCDGNNKAAQINRRGSDRLHWTPLHAACNVGNVEIVEEIMKVPEVKVNARDSEGNTPLMIAVSNNHEDVVSELLRPRKKKQDFVDPSIPDKYGWTPLLIAIGNKNVQIVKLLLECKINGKPLDVNAVVVVTNNEMINEDPNFDKYSSISSEAKAAEGRGITPLILAVDTGDEEILNLLLNRSNIDVNTRSEAGDSALSIAVKKRNLEFINDIISTKKVKKSLIQDAVKDADSLGLTEISQLLHNLYK